MDLSEKEKTGIIFFLNQTPLRPDIIVLIANGNCFIA
jgi:hypothetical protein